MRIGVISDTHDRLPTIRAALQRFDELRLETLLHPGDVIAPFAAKLLANYPGDLHICYGNNDGEREGLRKALPQIEDGPLMREISGKKILVHHYIEWCEQEDIDAADIIVTGHTHQVSVEQRHGKLLVNPGECCGWVTGKATVATIDLNTNAVELIELPT